MANISPTATAADLGRIRARDAEAEQALPVGLKVSWGLGAFGAAVLSNAVSSLAVYYLAKVVGMPAWLAGVLLTAARLYDAFFDPFVGHLSDRTPDRFGGRRRPFLLAGAFLCALAMLAVFNAPFPGASLAGAVYALAALLFYGTAYSVFNVPFIAMPAEMTDGYHERSAIHGWRVIFSGIGTAVAGSGSGLLLAYWAHHRSVGGIQANTRADYSLLAAIYAALIFVSMLASWRGTRSGRFRRRTEAPPSWRSQVKTFLDNKPFLTIMGVKVFQLIGLAANQAATFFMLVEVLKRSSASVAFLGLPLVPVSILITPVLVKFSRRFGKRTAYLIAAVFTGGSYLSWMFAQPGEPSWVLVLRGAALGVGFSGNTLFCMSMITDAIELDRIRTGMRREGMFTAFFSFCEKFAGALGPTVVGVALSVAGFSASAKVTAANYAHVRQATLLGVSYLPAGCAVLAILLLSRYKLDRDALNRARAARSPAIEALDPL